MKHRKLQIYRLFHLLSFLESRHGICYPPCIDVDCIGVALTILDIGLPTGMRLHFLVKLAQNTISLNHCLTLTALQI